jgi:hypothetical protein
VSTPRVPLECPREHPTDRYQPGERDMLVMHHTFVVKTKRRVAAASLPRHRSVVATPAVPSETTLLFASLQPCALRRCNRERLNSFLYVLHHSLQWRAAADHVDDGRLWHCERRHVHVRPSRALPGRYVCSDRRHLYPFSPKLALIDDEARTLFAELHAYCRTPYP